MLSVGYPGGGVSALLDVASGVRQNVLVPVQSNYGGPFRLSATQGFGEDSVEIAYQIVQGEGSYVLDFTPTTGNVHLNLIRVMSIDDGSIAGITLLSPWRWTLSYTNQNQLVQICPLVKDEYRFGFNGQQKDNEYAGIGNHNTAKFWEYDTRLGRRWNLDPVDQISISNYAAFANNTIFLTDPLGDKVRLHDEAVHDKKEVKGEIKNATAIKAGNYKLMARYKLNFDRDGNASWGELAGYRAYNKDGGYDYDLEPGDAADFKKNAQQYESAAAMYNAGTEGQKKMGIGLLTGDMGLVWSGIKQDNKEAWSNPMFVVQMLTSVGHAGASIAEGPRLTSYSGTTSGKGTGIPNSVYTYRSATNGRQ